MSGARIGLMGTSAATLTRAQRRLRARFAAGGHAGARRAADRLPAHRGAGGAVVARPGARDGAARRVRAGALAGGGRVAARRGAAEGGLPRSQAHVGRRLLHRSRDDRAAQRPALHRHAAHGARHPRRGAGRPGDDHVDAIGHGQRLRDDVRGRRAVAAARSRATSTRSCSPNEVAAIEVYNGTSVPPQFTTPGQNCAAVVVWTKTRVDCAGTDHPISAIRSSTTVRLRARPASSSPASAWR